MMAWTHSNNTMMSGNQDDKQIPMYHINGGYDIDDSEAKIDTHSYIDPSDWTNSFNGERGNTRKYSRNHSLKSNRLSHEPASWELLSQLPSRSLGLSSEDFNNRNGTLRSMAARNTDSKYSTMHLHGVLRHGDVDPDYMYNVLTDSKTTEEEVIDALRCMNQSLTLKRSIKAKITRSRSLKQLQRNVSCAKHFKYKVAMWWQHFRHELREIVQSVDLWHSHLKTIQGHFGSGVASYFFFLRWLFFLNLFGCIILISFLVTPQLIWQDRQENFTNKAFTGKEIITGTGAFEQTVMYYGFYTPDSVGMYKMPEAYLFGSAAYVIFSILLLSYSLARFYRRNYIVTSGELKNVYSNKVFSAWDYSIEKEEAAKLKSRSIYNELLELLENEVKEEVDQTLAKQLSLFLRRLLINVAILLVILAMAYLVFHLLKNKYVKDVNIPVLSEMTLSLVVTIIAYVVPLLFSALFCWEKYANKQTQLYFNMARVVILRLATLGVVTYFWLDKNVESEKELASRGKQCWETELGQEVYRLMMVDLFCVFFFSTLVMEFGRRIVYYHCLPMVGNPEFDIAQNTLDLIYTQMLTWVGFFYCPLLPLIALLKLVVIFYTKRLSVVYNCRPSLKPWKAGNTQTAFLMFTLFNFLLAMFSLGYSVVSLKPSSDCGPFSKMETRYDLIFTILKTTRDTEFLEYLFSPGVITGLLLFLGVVVYYKRATAKANREMVELLRDQLILEGKDKVFLLRLYDSAMLYWSLSRKKGGTTDAESKEAPIKPEPTVLFNEIYEEYEHKDRLPDNISRSSVDYLEARTNVATGQPKPGWGRERTPIGQRHGSQDSAYLAENNRNQNSPHRDFSGVRGDDDRRSISQRRGSPFLQIDEEGRPRRRQGPPEPPPSLVPHAQGFQYLNRDSPSYSPTRISRHSTPQRF